MQTHFHWACPGCNADVLIAILLKNNLCGEGYTLLLCLPPGKGERSHGSTTAAEISCHSQQPQLRFVTRWDQSAIPDGQKSAPAMDVWNSGRAS